MRPFYGEIISQYVTDESSKLIIEIDTPRLVFPKITQKSRFQTVYQQGKRYRYESVFFWLNCISF